MKLVSQEDQNGCGIACIASLINKSYDWVKKDFEKKFYKIDGGIKIADFVRYLDTHGLKYKSKFFHREKKDPEILKNGKKFSNIENSITLVAKGERYKTGHYLLKTKKGWMDPWVTGKSLDCAKGGWRKRLPERPWYVLYPIDNL